MSWLVAGVVLLVVSAELLVRGAVRLALAAGLSPLVVGLTVVSWGTSSPELAVSVGGALRGVCDIAVGNVVGSNIANVLLILGVAALIMPLTVARQLVRIELPVMIGISAALMLLAYDGSITRLEGSILLVALAVATTIWVRSAQRNHDFATEVAEESSEGSRVPLSGALVVLGLGGLWISAELIVDSAVVLASLWGLSELVIGLTIVAVGTSLPEIAVSLMAAYRGQADLAVGNVVGSNIFNILGILGLASLVSDGGLPVAPAALRFDLPVMLATALACLPVFISGGRIARWEGAIFLAYYAAYVTYLLLQAAHHDALPAFSLAMMFFAIPLTVVTMIAVAAQSVVVRGKRSG